MWSCVVLLNILIENDLVSKQVRKGFVIFCLPGWSHQTLTISGLLAKEALERSGFNSHLICFIFFSQHLITVWTSTGAAGKTQKTRKILRSEGSSETDDHQKERGNLSIYRSIYLLIYRSIDLSVCLCSAAEACDGGEECAAEGAAASVPGGPSFLLPNCKHALFRLGLR